MKNLIISIVFLLTSYSWFHLWTVNLIQLRSMDKEEQYQMVEEMKQEVLKSRPHCTKVDIKFYESEENINEILIYANCIEWSL